MFNNNERLDRIEEMLNKLLSRIPPLDSPTVDNLQCHLRKPNTPCKCVAWIEARQKGSDGQPDQYVSGCFRDMIPFIMNGAVVQSNKAIEQIDAARQDIQRVEARVCESGNRLASSIVGLFGFMGAHINVSSTDSNEIKLLNEREKGNDR